MTLGAASNLAAARKHLAAGEMGEAAASARLAALADPGLSEAFGLWGVAAAEARAYYSAIDPLRVAARAAGPASPRWALLTLHLGRALFATGHWREGIERLAQVELAAPAEPMLRGRLGVALVDCGLADRGLSHLEWAVSAAPDAGDLRSDLGWALLAAGRLDEAQARLEEALILAPDHIGGLCTLASLRRWTSGSNHIDRLRARRDDTDVRSRDRIRLSFSLFKELDDLDQRAEAWAVLEEANAASYADAPAWSSGTDAALTQALIRRFPRSALANRSRAVSTDRTPIFIVGLPRTGTTLLERILAGHSRVRALGEAPVFLRLFREAARLKGHALDARGVLATRDVDWPRIGARYLSETDVLAQGAAVSVDKLPVNSLFIGAIDLAFPNARIILLKRDPMDSLFSAYKMMLQQDTLYGWCYRQEDLAAHFRQHRRLMDHWRACLGERLIEVSYEDLVADPELQIRGLLNDCGLDFEPACLRPQESVGPILTHSNIQARAPISAASVGAWRRYEKELEPLRARLEAIPAS
jgi:tetratricopeptide (TPR) repeat protein